MVETGVDLDFEVLVAARRAHFDGDRGGLVLAADAQGVDVGIDQVTDPGSLHFVRFTEPDLPPGLQPRSAQGSPVGQPAGDPGDVRGRTTQSTAWIDGSVIEFRWSETQHGILHTDPPGPLLDGGLERLVATRAQSDEDDI